MTLYTYLTKRINKYRSLYPIEFQGLELELKTHLVCTLSKKCGYITQNPFHIEMNNELPIQGTCINMYNGNYKFSFVVNMHESYISICRVYYSNEHLMQMLDPLVEWFCKIFNFEWNENCFRPKPWPKI